MVSHEGTTFAADMGYRSKTAAGCPASPCSGARSGQILRVSDAGFSPGDDFCVVWHILDLFPGGAGEWRPSKQYLWRRLRSLRCRSGWT